MVLWMFTSNGGLNHQILMSMLGFLILHLARESFGKNVVINNEASSSPATITALKGSSVQIHWSYTLNSAVVPSFFTFKKQTCSVNDTLRNIVTVVAEKTTYSGQLTVKSGVPSSLIGRISVIGSNNTLLIKNLNYNDSFSQFYSTAIMTVESSGAESPEALKPIVQVTVEGPPTFVVALPKSLIVAENGELGIATNFDGNPEPSAEIEFPHSSTKSALTIAKLYAFIYRATYTFKPVPASYCGRTVITRVNNKFGSITETSTIDVTLIFADPDLRAGKPNETCVNVEWQKKESGACNVTYQVNYKTANNTIQFTDTVVNKQSIIRCGIPSTVNITSVELKMSSTSTNTASYSTSVLQTPLPPPTVTTSTIESTSPTTYKSTKSPSNAHTNEKATVTKPGVTSSQDPPTSAASTGVIVGGVIGGVIFLVLIVLLVLFVVKRGKRGPPNDIDSNEPGYPLADKKESIYASADNPRHSHAQDPPTYAQPEQPNLVYGKLGEGGGRKGPKPAKAAPSDYADVMLDENGYPVVGGYTEDNVDSYTEGYGGRGPEPPSYGSRKGSAGKGSGGRRAPPPYTEPKLDEDGYPKSTARAPPVYAQVDKSRKKR